LFAAPLRASELADLSNQDLATQAEEAFAEGPRLRQDAARARPHFRQSAELFEALRSRGVHNPLLYRNLGNAWLLAGELPRAILTYHEGLRLVPGDRDLLAGLDRARELVVYPDGTLLGRPARDDRPPWLPRFSSSRLLLSAMLFYVVGWVCLTRWWMVRAGRLLLPGVLALGGALGLGWLVVQEQRQESNRLPVVVIAEDGVLLRKGNNLHFPPRYETTLNRGVEALLLFQRGDWLQIQLGGGEIGWVLRNSCQLSDKN
jgi:hypothetical protein